MNGHLGKKPDTGILSYLKALPLRGVVHWMGVSTKTVSSVVDYQTKNSKDTCLHEQKAFDLLFHWPNILACIVLFKGSLNLELVARRNIYLVLSHAIRGIKRETSKLVYPLVFDLGSNPSGTARH